MNDLISRKQALKEMWKALYEYEDKTEKQFQKSKDLDVRDWIMNDRLWVQNGHNLCVNVLANLPSAQPVNYGSTKSDSSSQLKLNNDLISRQQAIDAVAKWFYDVFGITESDGTATIFKRLRELPSAQPHWIPFAEMMPAFGESVLVQFDDDDMDILTFPNIYKRLKRVAWMPLPKPYGGESE